MGIRRTLRNLFKTESSKKSKILYNLYKTHYDRTVLISYITAPFTTENSFVHQNYVTSHIISEVFSNLAYNVDIVDYDADYLKLDYNKYSVIFGFGYNFERSFYIKDRNIPRIHFITGAHIDLQNSMSLRGVRDFYNLSGIWLAKEANVLQQSCYYSSYDADAAVILAHGFVYDDYCSRFNNQVYSLNNNILNAFKEFRPKTKESRNSNFLFLSGNGHTNKGLHILLQVAKLRPDLIFHIVIHSLDETIGSYFKDVLESENVFLHKSIRMDSEEMKEIIETCTYSIAPSYVDGLPGGTIEPMSAGLIPIVSKYCGFRKEAFIFEFSDLSAAGLNEIINQVLSLDDSTYMEHSEDVKAYASLNYSQEQIMGHLKKILVAELSI